MLTAFLDTCVLWPSLQRNFLLSLAAEGVYRATWSEVILGELEYETVRKWAAHTRRSEREALRYASQLRSVMESAFPDALVTGWEALEGTFGLPDSDDEHVVAAAVCAQADVIVTSNLRDFPKNKLPPFMWAESPQSFVMDTVELAPQSVLNAIVKMSERSGRRGPFQAPQEVAQELSRRYGLNCVVELMG